MVAAMAALLLLNSGELNRCCLLGVGGGQPLRGEAEDDVVSSPLVPMI